MPRYVIERTPVAEGLGLEDLQAMFVETKRLLLERYPDLTWEHSHIVMEPSGRLKSFCIYDAPNEEAILVHAHDLGGHEVNRIFELGGDIIPADFPD